MDILQNGHRTQPAIASPQTATHHQVGLHLRVVLAHLLHDGLGTNISHSGQWGSWWLRAKMGSWL